MYVLHCLRSTLYWLFIVYALHGVHSTQFTLYTVYTLLCVLYCFQTLKLLTQKHSYAVYIRLCIVNKIPCSVIVKDTCIMWSLLMCTYNLLRSCLHLYIALCILHCTVLPSNCAVPHLISNIVMHCCAVQRCAPAHCCAVLCKCGQLFSLPAVCSSKHWSPTV